MENINRSICVVALGNPGLQYLHTRHNIGWMIIDFHAAKKSLVWKTDHPLYHICQYTHAGATVVLIKPQTYMNLSGKAAKKILQVLGYKHQQIVALVDEYNFPTGRISLKLGGSDGGHNGIASMIQELQTANFWRLRCGIDRKFGPGQLVDYVLGNFPEEEKELVESMIVNGSAAIDNMARIGIANVMQQLNSIKSPGLEGI